MANLSNINNILRISSSGVGLNKDNTGPSELDIESAGADMIDMTRTGQKTYRFAISGASAFSLFDVAAGVDRLTIDSSGNSTFAGNVISGGSGTFASSVTVNTNDSNILTLNRNSTVGGYMVFRNDNSDKLYIGSRGTVSGSGGAGYDIFTVAGNDLKLFTSATLALTLDTSQNATFAGETYFNKGVRFYRYTDQANYWSVYTNTDDSLRFNYNGSGNDEITIDSSGNSTFAGNVTITGGTTSGLNITTSGTQDTININRAASNDNAITKYQTASADKWIVGLRNTSDDNFRFYSYGTSSDVLTINQASGNVGIGTTSPNNPFSAQAALQVGDTSTTTNNGLITIGSGTAGSGDIYFADGTSGGSQYKGFVSYKHVGDYLAFGTAETTRMIINSSGNVGIGETNPAHKLSIKATDDTRGILVNNTLTTSYAEIALKASREFRIGTGGSASATDARDRWYVYDATASTHRLTLDSSGNFGIGTTSPSARLEVYGTDGSRTHFNEGLRVTRETVPAQFGMVNFNGGALNMIAVNTAGTGSVTKFMRSGNGTSLDTSMVIDNDGNVGIGTTSPSSKIDVREDANNVYTGYFYNSSTLANAHGINVQTATTNAGAYAFRVNSGSNTNALVVKGDANVGIGTATPASNTKLDVVGAIKTQTVAHSWYRCGPITSALAYRHIKTNLDMGVGGTNIQYIMGGFEIKGFGYYGSYPGFGHGTCMFHNWSGGFSSLDVRNYAMAGFVQNPYVSSDGFCVIVLRQNTYMQPVIDFCQYYTPYPWRTSVVTAESASANLTGVY